MKPFILTDTSSVANHYLAELRSVDKQQDRMRFRTNMQRLGEILAYEISKTLHYKPETIVTPLGKSKTKLIVQDIVIATILRAGLPFHQGFLNVFDNAENAFVASYRKVIREDGLFEIRTEYMVTPSLDNKILILADPMLATGQSLFLAWENLLEHGVPAHTHVASIISSRDGINFLEKNMKDFTLWTAAVDEELNSKAYIVPGLGDAGDLAFGGKI